MYASGKGARVLPKKHVGYRVMSLFCLKHFDEVWKVHSLSKNVE
jgi:hypothetical protein